MKLPFPSQRGLVLVGAGLAGPLGSANVQLALDTGAVGTLINEALLVAVGYDPAQATAHVRMTTASGMHPVPRLPVARLTALGKDRTHFPVLCHTLPASARVDGLLGLDFLRGTVLTLDFVNGEITLV